MPRPNLAALLAELSSRSPDSPEHQLLEALVGAVEAIGHFGRMPPERPVSFPFFFADGSRGRFELHPQAEFSQSRAPGVFLYVENKPVPCGGGYLVGGFRLPEATMAAHALQEAMSLVQGPPRTPPIPPSDVEDDVRY